MEQVCMNCKWWVKLGASDRGETVGECRIGRPQAIEGFSSCAWPQPRCADFCGEFEPKDDRASRLLGSKFMSKGEAA